MTIDPLCLKCIRFHKRGIRNCFGVEKDSNRHLIFECYLKSSGNKIKDQLTLINIKINWEKHIIKRAQSKLKVLKAEIKDLEA